MGSMKLISPKSNQSLESIIKNVLHYHQGIYYLWCKNDVLLKVAGAVSFFRETILCHVTFLHWLYNCRWFVDWFSLHVCLLHIVFLLYFAFNPLRMQCFKHNLRFFVKSKLCLWRRHHVGTDPKLLPTAWFMLLCWICAEPTTKTTQVTFIVTSIRYKPLAGVGASVGLMSFFQCTTKNDEG